MIIMLFSKGGVIFISIIFTAGFIYSTKINVFAVYRSTVRKVICKRIYMNCENTLRL